MLNLALVALSFASPSASPSLPAEVRLAWKFHEGDVLRYRILQDIRQEMSPMGMETATKVGQVLREKVQSVATDGTAKIEVTWEALRYHMDSPMGSGMEFDSTKDAPETVTGPMKGVAKIVGSAFQLEMKPSGEIVALRGIDEVMAKIAAGGEGGPMSSMLAKSFNDASMKRALETMVLPDKGLADGEAWKRQSQFDIPALGKLKVDFDFKLDGTETVGGSKAAKVGVLYSMSLGGGKPDMSGMPGAEQYDIDLTMNDAKGEGTIHFSPDLGRMVKTQLASDMDMGMVLKPKGESKAGEGEGIKMGIVIHQKLTSTLLGASEPAFEDAAKTEPKK